jgi:hypothetical protein
MSAPKFFDFSSDLLVQTLKLCDGAAGPYLASYLRHLAAKSYLVEPHYVDRHYLDEYSSYYSRSFRPPHPASCQRAHFFAQFTHADLLQILLGAQESENARREAEQKLQEHYLGFVVLRPLVSARLGRTVLRPYPAEGRRRYEVLRPYQVNIAGLRLTIEGLAYQQQDRGAAVCASTSLWSALQRVAYVAGHRSPTPTAVTQAARSPFPASQGLELNQMAAALANLGYIADRFSPAENRPLFRALVATALKSHLPVILLIARERMTGAGTTITVGHAVTVTGYSEPENLVAVPAMFDSIPPVKIRSGSLNLIYVHDDNLGSHAHYELHDSDDVDENGNKKLKLIRGRSGGRHDAWWVPDDWDVLAALVPKPVKLRLPLPDLLLSLLEIRPLLTDLFAGVDLHFDAAFSSGVELQRRLIGCGYDPRHVAAFLLTVALPRHVGVIRMLHDDTLLCEVVIDVTEIQRLPGRPSVLAILGQGVPADTVPGLHLAQICRRFNWSLLLAPPSVTLPASHPLANVPFPDPAVADP